MWRAEAEVRVDVSTNQGTPRIAGNYQKLERSRGGFFLWSTERKHGPCWYLDFQCLAPELWENRCLLSLATKFIEFGCSSPRKITQKWTLWPHCLCLLLSGSCSLLPSQYLFLIWSLWRTYWGRHQSFLTEYHLGPLGKGRHHSPGFCITTSISWKQSTGNRIK